MMSKNAALLSYGEEIQRQQAAFLPLDLSTVVLGIGIIKHLGDVPLQSA